MVAEERGLIVSVGENAEQNQNIYDEWYSITRLRDRAAQIIDTSPFGDVWQGLQQTFSLFEYGLDTNALGIPPLNGDLFHQKHAIPDLKGNRSLQPRAAACNPAPVPLQGWQRSAASELFGS